MTKLRIDQRGVVFVEFLVAFTPIWFFSLCVFQLVLIAQADLLVRHVANVAARSASVVLPDDPNEYGGEPLMSVSRKPFGADVSTVFGRIASSVSSAQPLSISSALSDRVIVNLGRSRLNTIRLAVHLRLMPLAPREVVGDRRPSLRKTLGDAKSLASAFLHQPYAVAVTFPDASGEVVAGPEVTVRVTYAYKCTVPLARHILCRGFGSFASGQDLDQAFIPVLSRLLGGTFRRLRHEATLIVHSAPYEYRARRSS